MSHYMSTTRCNGHGGGVALWDFQVSFNDKIISFCLTGLKCAPSFACAVSSLLCFFDSDTLVVQLLFYLGICSETVAVQPGFIRLTIIINKLTNTFGATEAACL